MRHVTTARKALLERELQRLRGELDEGTSLELQYGD